MRNAEKMVAPTMVKTEISVIYSGCNTNHCAMMFPFLILSGFSTVLQVIQSR